MKVWNHTPLPDHALRRMAAWCCLQARFKPEYIEVFADNGTTSKVGRSGGDTVLDVFMPRPLTAEWLAKVPGCEAELVQSMADDFVRTMFDGLPTPNGFRGVTRQQWVDGLFRRYERQREKLIAAWAAPIKPRPKKPKPSVVEQRAAKAADDLARWQRKLKLAQTKVKKLRTRCAYYAKKGVPVHDSD